MPRSKTRGPEECKVERAPHAVETKHVCAELQLGNAAETLGWGGSAAEGSQDPLLLGQKGPVKNGNMGPWVMLPEG